MLKTINLDVLLLKNGKEVSENAAEDVTAEEKPKKKK